VRGAGLLAGISIALAGCVHSDPPIPGVWAVDLATGDRTEVALLGEHEFPRAMAGDAASGHVFVVTDVALIRIDVATGDEVTVADAATGTGPAFNLLDALALDEANGRAFVYDEPARILQVDLSTGNRTVVSDTTTGTGPVFNIGTAAMVFDTGGARLIVATPALPKAGSFDDSLVAVDPATGDRTVLSDSTTGMGPAFSFSGTIAIAADPGNGRVVVAQNSTLLLVDLATGDRQLLYDGPNFRSVVAVDTVGSNVFQTWGPVLQEIQIATFAVTGIWDLAPGNGPFLADPRGIVLDPARNRVLIAAYTLP
jgi:hypothetical protein